MTIRSGAGLRIPRGSGNYETVIIFGSPVTGTLLMKENPEIGIELPSKLLIYSTNSDVYLLYKDPDEMLELYGIRESRDAIQK